MTDLSTVAVNDSFQDSMSPIQRQGLGFLMLMNVFVSASASRVEGNMGRRGPRRVPWAARRRDRVNPRTDC